MATETGRIIKRKRIKLPDGSTVDIPVISQISFIDAPERGQESQYTLDNTTDSDRTVHVASIPGNGEPTDETGQGGDGGDITQTLQVERIDRFKLLDARDRGQESHPEPDNKTIQQPPDAPPYFTTHAKTHIIKYIKRNDDDSEDQSTWIKSELIDQINFGDAPDRGQETQFTLLNPPDNQDIDGLRLGTDDEGNPTISVDSSVEEITSGVGGSDTSDTPVRTDPFQNIVDFQKRRLYWGWSNDFTLAGFYTTPIAQHNAAYWLAYGGVVPPGDLSGSQADAWWLGLHTYTGIINPHEASVLPDNQRGHGYPATQPPGKSYFDPTPPNWPNTPDFPSPIHPPLWNINVGDWGKVLNIHPNPYDVSGGSTGYLDPGMTWIWTFGFNNTPPHAT